MIKDGKGQAEERKTKLPGSLRMLCAGLAVLFLFSGCSRLNPEYPTAESSSAVSAIPESESEEIKPTTPLPEIIEPFPDAETSADMETVPGLKLLIASDIHYLARELTDHGTEFIQMVQHGDGKVTNYIWEITEAFTQEVIRENPDALIISGDLSLNGELKSHIELAGYLKQIEDSGIPVLIIPGNHDINNVGASRYFGGRRIPAEQTTVQQFYQIYREFGYDEAISRDPESLSYVYPLSDKVWGLMLDTCQYKEKNMVGGMIDLDTYRWIEKQLNAACEAEVMLLPVSHHNLLDESKIYQENCTIEHSERLIEILVGWGAPLHLSGHLHVQHYMNSDPEEGGTTGIYEIVTSSLATPPCQYGVLYFEEDGNFQYHTQILDMDSWAKASGQEDINLLEFSNYRVPFLENVFYNQAHDQLEKIKGLNIADTQIGRMCQVYARANCYYYWGRAVEMAKLLQSSEEYELWWKYAPNSAQTAYLEYILDEALTDYNFLENK